jgi:hypothetical protein
MRSLLLVAVASFGLSGCAFKSAAIPGANIPFASADYKVMGKTTAESCGAYVFMLDFAHLLASKDGGVSAGSSDPLSALLGALPIGGSPETSRALYKALNKMPEATHLLDIRTEGSFTGIGTMGLPLFGERCSTVHARGVKIKNAPVPNAN